MLRSLHSRITSRGIVLVAGIYVRPLSRRDIWDGERARGDKFIVKGEQANISVDTGGELSLKLVQYVPQYKRQWRGCSAQGPPPQWTLGPGLGGGYVTVLKDIPRLVIDVRQIVALGLDQTRE